MTEEKLFPKTVEITFNYRGVDYKHRCQLPLTTTNKLLIGKALKTLKRRLFTSLSTANYLYKEDKKAKEEQIYSLITQIKIFVIV